MFFCCHSKDLKFLHIRPCSFAFKNYIFMSNFSIFESQHSDLTLWVEAQSGAQRQDFFIVFLHMKLIWAQDRSKDSKYRDCCRSPGLGQIDIFKIFPPKLHLHEIRSVILVHGYDRVVCGKSNSPASLTEGSWAMLRQATPRRENEKFDTKIKILL
jgi:hypothetical protein